MASPNPKSEVVVALPADEWARIVKCISDWLMGRGVDFDGRYYVVGGLLWMGDDSTVDELRFERIAVDRARCVQIPSLVVIASCR